MCVGDCVEHVYVQLEGDHIGCCVLGVYLSEAVEAVTRQRDCILTAVLLVAYIEGGLPSGQRGGPTSAPGTAPGRH